MTTSDGYILGATRIFGSAPIKRGVNLVLLAEGFDSTQQGDFNNACDDFVDRLSSTAPFDHLMAVFNIYRVSVVSDESGADDPVASGGSGAVRRTYFDASFGDAPGYHRMLGCNNTTALTVAGRYVPHFSLVMVVVNSSDWGGTGGTVVTYSLAPGGADIPIHEMGHGLFHFADEYAYLGEGIQEPLQDFWASNIEPSPRNVTRNTDRTTLKWAWAVSATTPLPTMSNPDCTRPDGSSSPVSPGTVGLFEGAWTYHCGLYRPEWDCKMRQTTSAFCKVCSAAIYHDLWVRQFGTEMLFYNWSTGGMQTGVLDPLAGYTNFQGIGLSQMWNSIVSVDGELLFYHRATGQAQTGTVDKNGHFKGQNGFGLSEGWSTILAFDGELLFYNRDTGQAQTGTITKKGKLTAHGPLGLSEGWTHIVAVGTELLFYNNATGQAQTGTITKKGKLTAHGPLGLSEGWTHIVAVGAELLFYNRATGQAQTGTLDHAGNFTAHGPLALSKHWSSIVAVPVPGPIPSKTFPELMFYNRDTGSTRVGYLTTGTYTEIGAWDFSKGWTTITAIV